MSKLLTMVVLAAGIFGFATSGEIRESQTVAGTIIGNGGRAVAGIFTGASMAERHELSTSEAVAGTIIGNG